MVAIACVSGWGCSPSDFYCSTRSNGIRFGSSTSNTGTVRAMMGNYNSSSQFYQGYAPCASASYPNSIHNSPDDSASATQICKQLGYRTGTVYRVSYNACPEPNWSTSTGKWQTDYIGSLGYGKYYTCSNPCPRETTQQPSMQPTMNPTKTLKPLIRELDIECTDLTSAYELLINIDYDGCQYECFNDDNCKMVNYFKYLKYNDDTRCYLYNNICNIKNSVNINQTILGYKSYDFNCQSHPNNWYDSVFDDCQFYSDHHWCNNSQPSINYMDTILSYKDDNDLTAIDVCCTCGGGSYYYNNIQLMYFDKNIFNRYNNIPINYGNSNKQIKSWNNLMLYDVLNHNNIGIFSNFSMLLFNSNDITSINVYLCELNDTDTISQYFILIKQYNIYINKHWTSLSDSYANNIHTMPYSQCISQINFNNDMMGFYPLNALTFYQPTPSPTESPTNTIPALPQAKKELSSTMKLVIIIIVFSGMICIMSCILIYCWYVLISRFQYIYKQYTPILIYIGNSEKEISKKERLNHQNI